MGSIHRWTPQQERELLSAVAHRQPGGRPELTRALADQLAMDLQHHGVSATQCRSKLLSLWRHGHPAFYNSWQHQANDGVPRESPNYIPPVGYPPLAPSYAAGYVPVQGQGPGGPVVQGVAATAAEHEAQAAAHQAQAATHQAQANEHRAKADQLRRWERWQNFVNACAAAEHIPGNPQ